MNRRWFLLLALFSIFALAFGYIQLSAFFAALLVISGIAYLIDRWSERTTGKRIITIKVPKTTPPQ